MPIDPTDTILHAFDKKSLTVFLNELFSIINEAMDLIDPIVMIIEASNHATCLGYTPEEKIWSYWDVNDISRVEINKDQGFFKLTKRVILGHEFGYKITLFLQTTLAFHTTYRNAARLNKIISQLKNDKKTGLFTINHKVLSATDRGISIVVRAIQRKQTQTLRALIAAQVDIHALYKPYLEHEKTTLLHIAICEENSEAVHELIKSGVNVNQKLEEGSIVIDKLSSNRDSFSLNTVSELIDAGSNVDGAFASAAISGNMEIIKLFLSKGINIDTIDAANTTPLIYACQFRRDALAKFLIKNGANVNYQNTRGNTPLFYAQRNKNDELIKRLLAKKDV